MAIITAPPSVRADCLPQFIATLGQPGFSERVNAMVVFDDGTGGGPALFVGGTFSIPGAAGGATVTHVAKWNGSAWQPVGSNMPLSNVLALAVYDRGDGPALYASGGGTTTLARWNGSQWTAVPNSPNAWLGTLFVHDFGDGPELYVSGGFGGFPTIDGPTEYIARWNGSQWRRVGANGLISVVNEFAVFDAGSGAGDELYAVGSFAFFASGQPSIIGFGKFDGSAWHGVAGGFNGGQLNALKVFDDGTGPALFAAGGFTAAGGTSTFGGAIPANRIARWNGSTWSALGSGLNGVVQALQVFDEDSDGPLPPALFVAGDFTTAGGFTANHIAKWDGANWSALESASINGVNGSAQALALTADGASLVAAGDFTALGGAGSGGAAVGRIAAWTCAPRVEGDVTGDGHVNVADLLAVITVWGQCPAPPLHCAGDIAPSPDGDGQVNVADLLMVITFWGS